MPVHDWTKVPDGTFHHFHTSWIPLLSTVLNRGVLPRGFYAMAEQYAGGIVPDVLTLQAIDGESDALADGGGTAVAVRPPKVSVVAKLEQKAYARKANRLVIRHQSSDRIVAIVEILSAGNKANHREFESFLDKVYSAIDSGIHLLLIDLHPPTSRDPSGIHGAIWAALGDASYVAPANKPLTLASYVGQPAFAAYAEPLAVGDALPPMPLFLSPLRYVDVPLEASYMQAVDEIPHRARQPLEA